EGYLVLLASNGLEALQLTQLHQVDLLLIDERMPRMDGLELCQVYRRLGGQAPIILLSGTRMSPDEVERYGANEALRKPFLINALLEAVTRQLGPHGPGSGVSSSG